MGLSSFITYELRQEIFPSDCAGFWFVCWLKGKQGGGIISCRDPISPDRCCRPRAEEEAPQTDRYSPWRGDSNLACQPPITARAVLLAAAAARIIKNFMTRHLNLKFPQYIEARRDCQIYSLHDTIASA